MRLLLDTHAFLWFVAGSKDLTPRARRSIESARNEKLVSVASIWEIAIKQSLGKVKLTVPLTELVDAGAVQNGIGLLAIEARHVVAVASLPWHHTDPFDRLLIAQAQGEGLQVVTRDKAFDDYGVRRVW